MSEKVNVLIVDDEPGMCESLADILTSQDYLVVTAGRGHEALELLRFTPMDAMIVDLTLPDISGLRLLETIKTVSPATEVIFITGHASLDTALQAMDGAAYAYLTKPFDPQHLLRTLAKAVERRRLTEALRQSEERYRLVNENIMDAVFLLDLEGNLALGNPRGFALTGYSEGELIGRSILSLLTAEGKEEMLGRLSDVRLGRDVPAVFETRLIRKDGSGVWVEANIADVVKDGNVVGRLGVARDITERKRAEEVAKALASVGRELVKTLDLGRTNSLIVSSVLDLVNARGAALYRLDTAAGELRCVATAGALDAGRWVGRSMKVGFGVVGRAVGERRIATSSDVLTDPEIRLHDWLAELVQESGNQAVAAVPLIVAGEIRGALALTHARGRVFVRQEQELLAAFADQAAIALENARLYEDVDRRRREAEVLGDIARAISGTPDMGTVLQQVAEGAKALCGSDEAYIALLDEIGGSASFRYWTDPRFSKHAGRRVDLGKGTGGQVLATGRPFRTDNYVDDPRITKDYLQLAHERHVAAQLVVPISGPARVEGLLYVENRSARLFTERDEAILLRLADHAANVLRGHRLLLLEREARQSVETSQAALSESEARYRNLVEGSIQGIVVQQRGVIKFANTAMARMAGYRRAEELIGYDIWQFPAPHELPRLREYAAARLLGEPVPSRYEFQALRPDGQPIWVEILNSIVPWDGEPAILATLLDITDRKQLEEQFRQAQKLEAIGSLAGGIAHDFNNLLTVITGRTQIIAWRLDDKSPIRQHLELIEQAAERATRLTRQLLAFSRKQVLEPRVLELNQVVGGIQRMLQRLIPEDIVLVAESDPDLWRVRADPSQIEQILMNLVVNARDAMPGGGRLVIETRNVEFDESYTKTHAEILPGAYAMLAVSDIGCGMSPEIRAKIFEPFFTTKEAGKGTGLGLATVYGIVKQSGGHIWVYSEVGQGTVFKIYLPRVHDPLEMIAPQNLPRPRGTETVLLVEDEQQVRALARETLEAQGYSVVEATNPDEALRAFKEFRGQIHLLVSDVIMPGGSGPTLANALLKRRPDLKVLFTSGYPADAIDHLATRSRGHALLQKPFTPTSLAHKVREVLDAPQSAPGR